MTTDFTACLGSPHCEIKDSHLHHVRDARPVFATGWLVDLIGHPEQATWILPPRRSAGKRRR
ncbi:hypothetical protein P3T36_006886 [Kitasatospora sp. MAP12-15]|uniref:hypothetical protein n=1 Tax=unclassified Kitasatospora TaxID=2633591 RepID=UPI002475E314|nr:hypothetical protein [Kitasatospora sp. MAP12-44]MDH6111931.1 hypothetical protein [Kitasatospora sp. MAP12-44]